MTWEISGRSLELCSCKALCPCWLGPEGEPDQEWCGAVFAFDIESGSSDGVSLAGTRTVITAHWPENFFSGNGSARLYIGAAASAEQQRELEAIFRGSKGGLLQGLWDAVLSTWHPTRTGRVDIEWGETPSLTVDGFGRATLKPFQDATGKPTTLSGAAAQAAFQIDSMVLASGKDSSWSDPDLGSWQGDSATLHRFSWSA